jgi:hypothetical protein
MNFQQYGTEGGPPVSQTLRAMLTETGEHVYRLAFDGQAEKTKNNIFGVVVTKPTVEPQDRGWNSFAENRRCVYLCYDLCDDFPLYKDSYEYRKLQQAMERILEVTVHLLPFTAFQRSIAIYPELHEIFADGDFSGVFRDYTGSLLDLKMHTVLSRWQKAPFLSPTEPPDSTGRVQDSANRSPRDDWNTCFQSITRVYWYHAYVCEVIGEDTCDGFSESNAFRTYDAVCAKGEPDMAGKLALLDILKLVYRCNYQGV